METTTIALRKDVKDKVVELGNKGETYSDIILRLIESAKKRQLQDLLMDEKDTVPIEEALERAKKKWRG
jgi:predicted CopG family antitoxin